MFNRALPRRPLTLLLLALLVGAGCTTNDPVIPESTGTIRISPSPEAAATPWTLTGPNSFSASGTGAGTRNDLTPGAYTIVWADVPGWNAPASETRALAVGNILTFRGIFSAVGNGTVGINCEPDFLNAPWHLLGPKGLDMLGNGDAKLADMVPGEYWLSWGAVGWWVAPDGYAQTLATGGAIIFEGVYLEAPPEPTLPFAGTEDQLIENFRTVYEGMNFGLFAELMHPDFMMVLQPGTTQQFPDLGPTLDLDEELRIAERMFGGVPVTDPDGSLVPGISGIRFPLLQRQEVWTATPANDLFPDSRSALFAVTFYFDRPGYSTLKVVGMMKFYVAGRDSLHDGVLQTFYEMKGQLDLTEGGLKAVESTPFGLVKGLFR